MYGGKDTIIVLPQFQIDGMVDIMDFILSHPYAYSVNQIKQRFDLNEEEYQMIYSFCMPHERHRTRERYWITKYRSVYGAVETLVDNMKANKRKLVQLEKLEAILHKHGVGKVNESANEAYNSVEDEEEPDEV